MINKELLNKELEWYKENRKELKPVKFNKNKYYNLFKKYKNYGMTENYYCCYGQEQCCWQDLVEEGINWLTLPRVRGEMKVGRHVIHNIKNRKLGDRVFMYKDKDVCYIFIYARDTDLETDYHIWFSNNKEYSEL